MATSVDVAEDWQPKPKTKHISTACSICRTKKIRCDGAQPRCSHCILYEKECIYRPTEDKRKEKRKDKTAALEARIEHLEALLHTNGIPVPSAGMEPYKDHIITNLLAASNDDVVQSGSATESPALSGKDDTVVDQLSGRMGSLQLADDGELRFYGPTSNLTILQNGTLSIYASSRLSVAQGWQQILTKAGVGHHVAEELENHLLKLYFCWEDPSIHVVDEARFWTEKARCRRDRCTSSTYTELLTNSMCAVGASMTDRRYPQLPPDLPEFFASRSRALLDIEMDSPSLSTVQSLVILSAVEALLTRDARGWLYSGMAVRLATDLGLHVDIRPYIEEGIISREEAKVRSDIFWGTFVHDRMWSLYVGRPCGLESKHITLAYPEGTTAETAPRSWSPYVDENNGLPLVRLYDPLEDMTKYNVLLCAKMQSIREVIYNNHRSKRSDLIHISNFVMSMSQELRQWHADLPMTLAVDYDYNNSASLYLPQVLQLHMQYHCIMIHVNRPFVTGMIKFSGNQSIARSSREACSSAAKAIANLLRIYDRLYTLSRFNVQAVHIVFTAAVIFVYRACTGAADDREAAAADLELCSHALRTIGQRFKNAIRAHEVIIYLKVQLLSRRRMSSKRSQPSSASVQDTTSKRQRLPTDPDVDEPDLNFIAPDQDQSPMTEWMYLNFDPSAQSALYLGNEGPLDSFFWSNFTAIDTNASNDGGWNPQT